MELVLSLLLAAMLGALAGWVAAIVFKREDILIIGIILGIIGAAAGALVFNTLHLPGGPLALVLINIAAAFLLVFVANLLIRKKK